MNVVALEWHKAPLRGWTECRTGWTHPG